MEKFNCSECIHYKVCKYIEKVQQKKSEITKADLQEPFEVNYSCKYYEQVSLTTVKKIYAPDNLGDLSEISKLLQPTKSDSGCDGCAYYETVIKTRKTGATPYIGDSPCDWCFKRRATCDNSNATSTATTCGTLEKRI